MRWPGRTIWDTRVQSICGILTAADNNEVHLFATASFAQVTLAPPRIIVNPNRTYAIEPAIRNAKRFAINVLSTDSRDLMIKLMRMRRRQPYKDELLGLSIRRDDRGIPYIEGTLQTIFCEVETILESGDRRLYIARVIENLADPSRSGKRPLLFGEVTEDSSHPRLRRILRTTLLLSGLLDGFKSALYRLRPPAPPDIARNTYEEAGATEEEIDVINERGLLDGSRYLLPPPAPQILKKRIGVCVVGTGWGQTHCQYLRRIGPKVRLFVCGQNPHKTARIAKLVGAEDYFLSLEKAVEDNRVDALTLALPHDLHRSAVEVAASARKHALVEKPIATTLSDADSMIESAKNAGTILMVAEDMHFRPAIREAVRLILSGDVGEPLYLLAHGGGVRKPQGWAADKKRLGGGVLMDIGVHYVRALRLLMGEPDYVTATRARQINTKMSGEDSVQLVFSSRFGWEAHMLLSWSTQRGELPDVVLAGDQGTLHLWPGAGFLDFYPVKPRLGTRLVSLVRPYSLQARLLKPRLQRIRIRQPDVDHTGYLGEMKEFVAAVSENREPVTGPKDGRRDLEIILKCFEALRVGGKIEIDSIQVERSALTMPSMTHRER